MRIGLLTTSFPRFEGDIAGDFVLGFSRALVTQGHRVDVLAPEPAERIAEPRWPGVSVRFVPYVRPRSAARTFYGAGVPDNLLRDPRAWLGPLPFCAALLRAARARRGQWDAIVSHFGLPCALIAGMVREQRPHLAVFHSADMHLLSRLPLRSAIAARLVAASNRLLFVSERERARFLAWLPPEPRARACADVQPMGIGNPAESQPQDRAALRRQLGLDRFTLLTFARLVPVKGLVEAASALRERADLTWVIGGEGPERSRLLALARDAKLELRLLGNVTGARKQAWLRAADAFVLPSRVLASGRSEGVPTAALEAMAAGLATLASRVGSIPELIAHEHDGLLFDPHTPGALAHALDRVMHAPDFARTLAARAQRSAARHRWDAIAPRLAAMLEPAQRRGLGA